MADRKRYRLLVNILILTCLVVQAGFAMPLLSQIWALDTISHDVEPTLMAPLSGCEYVIADQSGGFKFSDQGLHRVYSFIRYRPPSPIFTSLYSRNQRLLPDNREEIRYLIMSHFHGSRYKDAALLPRH